LKSGSPKSFSIDSPQANDQNIRYELEKSMVDMKYKQQMEALQKKPNNALTKKLLNKV
jgi:hypothetical protein